MRRDCPLYAASLLPPDTTITTSVVIIVTVLRLSNYPHEHAPVSEDLLLNVDTVQEQNLTADKVMPGLCVFLFSYLLERVTEATEAYY